MDSDPNVLKNLILSQSHILSYLLDLSESNNSFMMSILTSFIVENNRKNPEKVSSLLRTITQNNDIKKELLELKKKFETLYISPNQDDYNIYSNKVKIVKNELTNLQKVLLILSPDNIDTYNESIGVLDVDSQTITKDDVETLEDELIDKTKSELINESKNEVVENIIDEFKDASIPTDTDVNEEINTERLDNLKDNIISDILVENNITKDDDDVSLFEDLINANASDPGVVYDLNQAYTEISAPEPEPLQNNNTENSKDILNTIINHLVLDTEQKAENPNIENTVTSTDIDNFNDIIEPATSSSVDTYQISNEFTNLFEEINKQIDSYGNNEEINSVPEKKEEFENTNNENNVVLDEFKQKYVEELKNDPDFATLIISEVTGLVTLPYTKEKIPLANYKYFAISRFKEAYKLMRYKEKGTVKESLGLANELMFRYDLHPAIITACQNIDELDIYLSCLDTNSLDEYPFFEVKFEALPITRKKDHQ